VATEKKSQKSNRCLLWFHNKIAGFPLSLIRSKMGAARTLRAFATPNVVADAKPGPEASKKAKHRRNK
jgi:hypothetical protein